MTTYNAKDLIEQAAMLADLQNSDFISWKENMMFLDNAWADLYQQIINHGDKTFIKTFTFTGNRVELPDDFYQLNYVCYSSGFNRIPINRKAKTASSNGPFYDLIGNELVIYNKLNSMQTIEVDYFPTRDSITFAADERVLDDHASLEYFKDVCDRWVLINPLNTGWAVYDLIGNTKVNISVPNNAFMVQKPTSSHIYGDNNFCVISDTTKPYFKKDFRAYYAVHANNKFTIYKSDGQNTIYKEINDVAVVPTFPTGKVNAMSDYGLYWIENGSLKYWDFETKLTSIVSDNVVDDKVYCYNNVVYYETGKGVMADDQLVLDTGDYNRYLGTMKADLKTGYGILVDNGVIKSAFPNTELDYPNNFYFNYMAYQLAVYYKIKQNQDPSGLVALANNALKTFYDSLPKDENEYVRIANVYAR